MQKSPWHWVASLFAAEEIPACIVTNVALLMFLQTHTSPATATCYCGLLFLPWILKSLLRTQVCRLGHFRRQLQGLELTIAAVMMSLSCVFPRFSGRQSLWLFLHLFLLSLFTAWHELAARMYYERMLHPHEQRLWNRPKIICSQSAVVLTYGVFIIFVGALEVIYRNIPRAWAEGCRLASCILLLFTLYHIAMLRKDNGNVRSTKAVEPRERSYIRRLVHNPRALSSVLALFLLLLPQSLMFHSRVLFLLAPRSEGGLGCTLIDVGFAQGVVGVIAFSIGILLGRQWQKRRKRFAAVGSDDTVSRSFRQMAVALGLSPVVYLLMTCRPPASLSLLCTATFLAQFFFGFGLNAAMPLVCRISGERYRSTINYLYIPLVAAVMLLPMAASGWLAERLGFRPFFLADALTAPVAWFCAHRLLYGTDPKTDSPQKTPTR